MTITGTVGDLLRLKAGNLWTIEPEKTVFEGIKMMAQKNIGALPVVSGGRLVGMLSERDYTRKVALLGRSSKETNIGQILSTPVTTATAATTIVPSSSIPNGVKCPRVQRSSRYTRRKL